MARCGPSALRLLPALPKSVHPRNHFTLSGIFLVPPCTCTSPPQGVILRNCGFTRRLRPGIFSAFGRKEGRSLTMDQETITHRHIDDIEIQEWLESLDSVLESSGTDVAREILERLRAHATVSGIDLPFTANTPYANTIPARLEP